MEIYNKNQNPVQEKEQLTMKFNIFESGIEILPKEGTNQSDRGLAFLGILLVLHTLLDFVLINELQTKEVTFADDPKVAEKLADIKNFWDKLATVGPRYGCFPKATKSYLIVKKDCLKDGPYHVY